MIIKGIVTTVERMVRKAMHVWTLEKLVVIDLAVTTVWIERKRRIICQLLLG